jgi:tetratricopeptide (TPR) repeat protein
MGDKLSKLRKSCMFVCASLVLVYLTLLCVVHPAKELLFAIAVELVSFGGYLYFGYRRSQSVGGRAGEAVISELSNQYAIVNLWRRVSVVCTTAFWLAVTLGLAIDCLAFCTAFFGAHTLSLAIYQAVPISRTLGMHPGASLEVLAGAYVEAHKYDRALPLYEEVWALRIATFGNTHKEIAAIFCDFGDLYTHQNKLAMAESCYRIALGISTALQGDKGSGRAYTRLADCLRDQGRYADAARQYQSAYDMRVHQFGSKSTKVAETLVEWAKMLKLQGRDKDAAAMQLEAAVIQARHHEPSPLWGAFLSLVLFGGSLLVSNLLIGRNGILTELVVGKIKASVDAASPFTAAASETTLSESAAESALQSVSSVSPSTSAKVLSKSQLSRLITLYRFQKKYDEAERYNALLLRLGKD